ncbi:hypothetical protein DRN58_08485 [Thermococci archaeon]|nr:MAG: hypothetical protein DRN58_08485 [Thermococci archaeon]
MKIEECFTTIENGSKYKFRAWPSFDKKTAEEIVEVMESEGYGSVSETIRQLVKIGIERRDVRCSFCGRMNEKRLSIEREGKFFCNLVCYSHFIAEKENVKI